MHTSEADAAKAKERVVGKVSRSVSYERGTPVVLVPPRLPALKEKLEGSGRGRGRCIVERLMQRDRTFIELMTVNLRRPERTRNERTTGPKRLSEK